MAKKILIVGNLSSADELRNMLVSAGGNVIFNENFNGALGQIPTMCPDAIVMVMPVYFESATEFVEEVRRISCCKRTPLFYVGGLIERAGHSILQKHGVKTITLGPVTTNEIVRLIMR